MILFPVLCNYSGISTVMLLQPGYYCEKGVKMGALCFPSHVPLTYSVIRKFSYMFPMLNSDGCVLSHKK